ncbi:MAG: SNF2 helicase-associated domain-containing protein, partial [Rubrobacteraceae bacterium]
MDALRSLLGRPEAPAETFSMRLPGYAKGPLPSPQLDPGVKRPRRGRQPTLRSWNISGLSLAPLEAVALLMEWLEEDLAPPGVRVGDSMRFWQWAAQLALEALAGQRVTPGLERREDGLHARWIPLLDGHRLDRLADAMPPICRAAEEEHGPRALLDDFLEETCDALMRAWAPPPESARDTSDPGSRWLRALFGAPMPIHASAAQLESLERSHHLWLRNLKLAGDEHFRVALRLSSPKRTKDDWSLDFALQARDDPSLLVSAADVWRAGDALAGVRRLEEPGEKLLTGLGYAARFFEPIERALESAAPEGLRLDADEAFRFLRDCAPLLEESGFGVLVPPWWRRS